MADPLDQELDQRTAMALLSSLIESKFRNDLQQRDPLRQAQTQAAQAELAQHQKQLAAGELPLPPGQGPLLGYGPPQVVPNQREYSTPDTRTGGVPVDFEGQPITRPVYAQGAEQRGAPGPRAVNTVAQLAALMGNLKGLQPETAQSIITHLTGIPGPAKLEDALAKLQFKHELGQGQRDTANEGMKQRLELSQQQLAALIQQRQAENEMRTQAQNLREQTGQAPHVPFKEATKQILEMAQGGATPGQLAEAIRRFGYEPQGNRRTGGFLGMGGTDVPVLGVRRPGGATSANTAAPEASSAPQIMTIQNQQTGKQATGPAGPVPKGWIRVN